MGKRILIATMLVLTLLLLMPSIPAIQQKTIEEGIRQDIQEKLDTIDLNDLEEIEELEGIKHPILYVLVIILRNFRCVRLLINERITDVVNLFVEIPMMLLILYFLRFTIHHLRIDLWNEISDRLGWGWSMPVFPDWFW